ncbi:GAF and HD-GYP domain-containing protein [Marinobacterium litorale]|uniref:GAF and HD-GYP domain-containing protein n=1 Tax=Marinobacterium litorale TaxID=404770 RepID=UPI00042237C9|nr:HD domain-containing phosphohydrolase [Marinobacterium litorale]
MQHEKNSFSVAEHLARLASSLQTEADHQIILEQVVDSALDLLNSDGATLYIYQDGKLNFSVLRNLSLNIRENAPSIAPIPLYKEDGEVSDLVVARAYVAGQTINIPDIREETRYDFSGTHKFDQHFGYESRSFLCVPLTNHEDEVIGVLQMINALDDDDQVVPFQPHQAMLAEALGGIAATVLTQRILIDAQRKLFESFIRLIAEGIDYKSPVTGRHCQQVPEIAMMLAQGVREANEGKYGELNFTDQEMYELKIAAWMHDCGKITTPESVIEKGTKLEKIFDRIELVAGRMREYQQSLLIDTLRQDPGEEAVERCERKIAELDDELEFLRSVNKGGEFITDEALARLEQLAAIEWEGVDGVQRRLIEPDELKNLSIARGTLLPEEIEIMRDHIRVTDRMLHSLIYPKNLSQVADIAVNHHEHLDGTGYPKGLKSEDLTVRARIMCIADIFEALTAPDRPYKPGMKLSQALTIIGRKVEDGHLDADLFRIFVKQRIYRQYADKFMAEHQIDEPDLNNLPGYAA